MLENQWSDKLQRILMVALEDRNSKARGQRLTFVRLLKAMYCVDHFNLCADKFCSCCWFCFCRGYFKNTLNIKGHLTCIAGSLRGV